MKPDHAHPELFKGDSSVESPQLAIAEKLAVINANAPVFSTTASRLTSVEDSPIPSVDSSVSLVALSPRISRAQHRQRSQAEEFEALRSRSAALLQRWYEVDVLGSSECWSEWENRLMEIEKAVRRAERQAAQGAKASDLYISKA